MKYKVKRNRFYRDVRDDTYWIYARWSEGHQATRFIKVDFEKELVLPDGPHWNIEPAAFNRMMQEGLLVEVLPSQEKSVKVLKRKV